MALYFLYVGKMLQVFFKITYNLKLVSVESMKGHEIALAWELQDGVPLESQGHLPVGESSPQACTCPRRRHTGCCAFPSVNDPLVPTAT